MNDQTNKLEILDKYLEKSIGPEEEKLFEKELRDDPELKQELLSHKLLVDGIRFHGRKSLKREMSRWDSQLDENPEESIDQPVIRSFRWYYAAAAVIILIVSVVVIMQNIDSGQDNIVASHYEPFVFMPEQTRSEAHEPEFAQLFQYYEHVEYLKTIELINQIEVSERPDIVRFMHANALQAVDNFDEAIPIYESLVKSNSDYLTGAKWYLSLCYLSVNRTSEAKEILADLSQVSSSYANKALKLLNDLE